MNTPEYRKAYLKNLKLQTSNDNKHLQANKRNASVNQYMQNSGKQVLGISGFENKPIKK